MQEIIDLYCKVCHKSFKLQYCLSGNNEVEVMPRMVIKCHYCKRALIMKKYTEGMLVKNSKDGKMYI